MFTLNVGVTLIGDFFFHKIRNDSRKTLYTERWKWLSLYYYAYSCIIRQLFFWPSTSHEFIHTRIIIYYIVIIFYALFTAFSASVHYTGTVHVSTRHERQSVIITIILYRFMTYMHLRYINDWRPPTGHTTATTKMTCVPRTIREIGHNLWSKRYGVHIYII